MSVLKQRVPFGTIQGKDVFITREWLEDLQRVIAQGSSTTTGTGSSDLTALTAAVTLLNTNLTALTARVRKLEQGYQA